MLFLVCNGLAPINGKHIYNATHLSSQKTEPFWLGFESCNWRSRANKLIEKQEGINIYDRCNTMQDLNIHKSFPVESHCQETVWIGVYLPSRRSSLLSVTVTSSHSKRSKLGVSGMFILSGLQGSWAHKGWDLLYNMSLRIPKNKTVTWS